MWPRIPSPRWHIDFEEGKSGKVGQSRFFRVADASPPPLTYDTGAHWSLPGHKSPLARNPTRTATGTRTAACEWPHLRTGTRCVCGRFVSCSCSERRALRKSVDVDLKGGRLLQSGPPSHLHAHKRELYCPERRNSRPLLSCSRTCTLNVCLHYSTWRKEPIWTWLRHQNRWIEAFSASFILPHELKVFHHSYRFSRAQ